MSHLKALIKNSEDRIISYKRMISEAYQYKMPDWYKESLRDSKNFEARWLKSLVEEREHEIQGLSSPFYYLKKHINKRERIME